MNMDEHHRLSDSHLLGDVHFSSFNCLLSIPSWDGSLSDTLLVFTLIRLCHPGKGLQVHKMDEELRGSFRITVQF